MKRFTEGLKRFWKNEEGIGTLEIILIIAVIVIIAVIFKDMIVKWVKALLGNADTTINEKFNTTNP
ncbi:multidrug transporter [Paenibacillus sp. KS1]|uniref:Flp1 family type IVb pilin n=1 Tax=Paenibacillus sp. KS1 TaxID=1849249 RepID=UPI00080645BC|nr:Flp1 family type IVb pilin [Paenibacillus sp. KS1]OBY77790.1 multidrug transporter [Paenibacillus sp. KS1]